MHICEMKILKFQIVEAIMWQKHTTRMQYIYITRYQFIIYCVTTKNPMIWLAMKFK